MHPASKDIVFYAPCFTQPNIQIKFTRGMTMASVNGRDSLKAASWLSNVYATAESIRGRSHQGRRPRSQLRLRQSTPIYIERLH